jgi:hypothetical protein
MLKKESAIIDEQDLLMACLKLCSYESACTFSKLEELNMLSLFSSTQSMSIRLFFIRWASASQRMESIRVFIIRNLSVRGYI